MTSKSWLVRVLQMMEPLIIVVWQKNCAISHLMYGFSLALFEHYLAPIDEDLSLRQALMKIFPRLMQWLLYILLDLR